MNSSRYVGEDLHYRNSRIISAIAENDSLLNIGYVHFMSLVNAWVNMVKHSSDNSNSVICQYNLPRSEHIFLPTTKNRRNQILLDSLFVNGSKTGYDHPPFSMIQSDGTAIMVWYNRSRKLLHQFEYGQNIAVREEPLQPVPIICGYWQGRNLFYNMAYDGTTAELTVNELLKWENSNAQNAILSSAPTIKISSIKALPLVDDICVFHDKLNSIATIPYRSERGDQLSILDLGQNILLDNLVTKDKNSTWIPLRFNEGSLELALVDAKAGNSTIFSYQIDSKLMQKKLILRECITDAFEVANGDMCLLTNKHLLKLRSQYKITSSLSVSDATMLFSVAYHGKNQCLVLYKPSKQRLELLDENFSRIGKVKTGFIKGKILQVWLMKVPGSNGKKLNLSLLTDSTDPLFSQINSQYLEVLPEGYWANFKYRTVELFSSVTHYIGTYINDHPFLTGAYFLLIALAIALSMKFSKQLMQNKITDLSCLLPVPNNDKKYLHQILQLLRNPSLATAAILNIDIVEFSRLVNINRDRPDMLSRILMSFYEMFIEEASQNGGTISKIMGDGIIAVFGWPNLGKFYVNDPRKNLADALKTAFALLEKPLEVEGIKVNFRIGITIGEIFIGYFGNSFRRDYMAMGLSLELSESIQKAALNNSLSVDQKVVDALQKYQMNIQTSLQGTVQYNNETYDTFLVSPDNHENFG